MEKFWPSASPLRSLIFTIWGRRKEATWQTRWGWATQPMSFPDDLDGKLALRPTPLHHGIFGILFFILWVFQPSCQENELGLFLTFLTSWSHCGMLNGKGFHHVKDYRSQAGLSVRLVAPWVWCSHTVITMPVITIVKLYGAFIWAKHCDNYFRCIISTNPRR